MPSGKNHLVLLFSLILMTTCNGAPQNERSKPALEILGDPNYLAISYGGNRHKSRTIKPSQKDFQEHLKILEAIGVKIMGTYNIHLPQSEYFLEAIRTLKNKDPKFKMGMMLNAWNQCENASIDHPNHEVGDEAKNALEIDRAIALTQEYHVPALTAAAARWVMWKYHLNQDRVNEIKDELIKRRGEL